MSSQLPTIYSVIEDKEIGDNLYTFPHQISGAKTDMCFQYRLLQAYLELSVR